jgi:2-iminoacetate synthase ThiH
MRGKQIETEFSSSVGETTSATEQFAISDIRSAEAVALMLRGQGLEPVWKDWDAVILNHSLVGSPL